MLTSIQDRLERRRVMARKLKIDFVSDVSCPWCAVGLGSLDQALARVQDEITAEVHFQPFELNPQMGPEGQDISEHLTEKYGSTPAQQADIRDTIGARGAEVDFVFNPAGRGRIWNTFDAHRLMHLAEVEGGPGVQNALKRALLEACHTRSEPMADHDVLLRCAVLAGLDGTRAKAVLEGDAFSADVREREDYFTNRGIRSVPAVIIDDRHLLSGAQPVETFEQALRQIARETAQAD